MVSFFAEVKIFRFWPKTMDYRIAGKFDGDLNLANWRFWTATAKVYSRQIYDLRTVMLPSASHRQI